MTGAERQARYRTARAAGVPAIRTRRPADHRGRAKRWHDTVAALVAMQAEYAAWLAALPANLQESALAEALQAICRSRPWRAAGDRTAAQLRPGLSNRMAQSAWAAMTRATAVTAIRPIRRSAR